MPAAVIPMLCFISVAPVIAVAMMSTWAMWMTFFSFNGFPTIHTTWIAIGQILGSRTRVTPVILVTTFTTGIVAAVLPGLVVWRLCITVHVRIVFSTTTNLAK